MSLHLDAHNDLFLVYKIISETIFSERYFQLIEYFFIYFIKINNFIL